jgi:alkanesulfonate monooxygenase SsuD/methylene tetrahydromethanopterin reductase-like flavin-dependent oxidoreductase (luciferase family)
MLRVGVRLPAAASRIGDYLADVIALETAGADSIWLDDVSGPSEAGDPAVPPVEPWILYGALAAVTHRIRLGVTLGSSTSWAPVLFAPGLESLGRLSGGRVVVSLSAGSEVQTHIDLMMRGRPDVSAPAILIACSTYFKAERYALLADGVILIGGDEGRVADVGAKMREFREAGAHNKDFELWAAVPMPPDRSGWAAMVGAHEAAGATGIVVSWDPRLIDLLRNAGEPDDRTDLLIATG